MSRKRGNDGRLDVRLDPRERATAQTMPVRKGARRKKKPSGRAKRGRTRSAPSRRSAARLLRRGLYWSAVCAVWLVIVATGVVAYHAAHLPPTSEWKVPDRPPNVEIRAADGSLLAIRGDTGGEAVRLKELPAYLPQAVIAIEDRRFNSHFGFDPIGFARAMVSNLLAGRLVQGGSTITQQLAKNLFLKPDRTMKRKIQEMVLAFWLEAKYSKNEILEMYLNRVYLGAGAYGVDAAARRYFGKPAAQVTLAEAATLAALLKAPSRYSPRRDPERARARARLVLAAMAEEGYITGEEARIAQANPARSSRRYVDGSGNYVADRIMEILPGYIGAVDSDIIVETTIDPDLQNAGELAIETALAEDGTKRRVGQAALVAIDGNGAVRALIGGRSYAQSQFNRAIHARRQPGSAFKPFVYLAALEYGLRPQTVRLDEPVVIGGWRPENYARKYFGPVTLKKALVLSLNTVAARIADEVGPKSVVEIAHRLGIESKLAANPSIALGTSEVTPLELTAAYVPFSNGGYGIFPHLITRIRNADGRILYDRTGSGPGRVIAPPYLAMMNEMMTETLRTGTGRRAGIPGWQAAGKTGTSQDFRDAWFVGYTARLTAAVWFGNDDNTPMRRVTGGGLPARTWSRFMTAAHRGVAPVPLPGAENIATAARKGDPSDPVYRHLTTSRRSAGAGRHAPRNEDNDWIAPQANTGGLLGRLFGG